jgi:hypothetical protein
MYEKDWNKLILKFDDYSFFHTMEWAKVINNSYNYIPKYFLAIDENEVVGIVPLMFIESWLTGKRAVSLPFSDFCGPLFKNDSESSNIFQKIYRVCRSEGQKYIEFRSATFKFPKEAQNCGIDYRHVLKLEKTESELLKSLSENTRRNIKKAVKSNLILRILNDFSGIKLFYEMHCETRKKHGLPPQPFYFFNNILKVVIEKSMGDILFAEKDGKFISGAIYFKFGNKLLYKFGASYSKYFELRGNNFVMWEAIKKYQAEGFYEFDFGLTELNNEGLRKFKLGWNTEEKLIYTTRYNIFSENFLPIETMTEGFHTRVFNQTPVFILKIIGSVLYKHIG